MNEEDKFTKLPTCCLTTDEVLPFDIYIKRNGKTVLWRGHDTAVGQKEIEQLTDSGIEYVYVGFAESDRYIEYAEENAQSIIRNKKIPVEYKSFIMDKITGSVLENLFKDPTQKKNAKRLENIIKPMVELLLADKEVKALRFMVEKGDMAFSYIPHSARTCYYTIGLAEMFKHFTTSKLYQIGIAALLHDIGQTLVSPDIREKIGDYSDKQRVEMQRHPIYSVELIRRSELYKLDIATLTAIKSHHELGDKSGYPNHTSLFDLSLESKILAVTHTFESFTIERIHREARKPYDVIKYMLANPDKYPVEIVRKFIKLLGSLETY